MVKCSKAQVRRLKTALQHGEPRPHGGNKALKPKPNGGRKHENMTVAEENSRGLPKL